LTAPQEVGVLLGACLMLRRDVVKQVGLLDEEFFIYSEEPALCYRIGRAGWGVYWAPAAEMIHYGGQSMRQVAAEMFLQLYRGKVLYFRKHHGRLSALLDKSILLLASTLRLSLTPLAFLERPVQRDRHLLSPTAIVA
jgi:GT2 family glycosyltransferase